MGAILGHDFIEGELGVINLNFDSVDLGKTTDVATLEFIEDVKDIMFAQNGTQPYDMIPTGQAYRLTAKLGQITLARLVKVLRGLTVSSGGHSAKFGRDLYRSGRATFAKQLISTRVDSDGNNSTNQRHRLVFFLAMPTVNGALGPFGPDTQRDVEVAFYIFFDETTGREAFGYSGFASSLGMSV